MSSLSHEGKCHSFLPPTPMCFALWGFILNIPTWMYINRGRWMDVSMPGRRGWRGSYRSFCLLPPSSLSSFFALSLHPTSVSYFRIMYTHTHTHMHTHIHINTYTFTSTHINIYKHKKRHIHKYAWTHRLILTIYHGLLRLLRMWWMGGSERGLSKMNTHSHHDTVRQNNQWPVILGKRW